MSIDCGSPGSCHDCGKGPATRRGLYFHCKFHMLVWEIVAKATGTKILIVRNDVFEDFNGKAYAEFIEEELNEYLHETEEPKFPHGPCNGCGKLCTAEYCDRENKFYHLVMSRRGDEVLCGPIDDVRETLIEERRWSGG